MRQQSNPLLQASRQAEEMNNSIRRHKMKKGKKTGGKGKKPY